MTISALKDRALVAAAHASARLTMSAPVERPSHQQFCMTVTAVTDLTPSVRRLTFAADELVTFVLAAPDEYFGLLMSRPGHDLCLPEGGRANVRAAISAMAPQDQPDLRWYTIRAHRPLAGEIDVDVVTHGDAGPGSSWVRRARVGDRAGFRTGGALYRGLECTGPQLLVADETAVPALLAILEDRARLGHPFSPEAQPQVRVHVELPSAGHALGLDLPDGVVVHGRGEGVPGSAVARVLREDPRITEGLEYAWLSGESGMVTGLRRHLVGDVGMHRRSILFCGYWKLGEARG